MKLRQVPMTLEEANKEVDALGTLLLMGYLHEPKSLEEFIRDFFGQLNGLYANYGPAGLECGTSRRRSIVDLVRICKGLGYNTSVEEVRDIAKKLVSERRIHCIICSDVKRRVFRKGTYNENFTFRDEFGWKFDITVPTADEAKLITI